MHWVRLIIISVLLLSTVNIYSQQDSSAIISGIVIDQEFNPVQSAHIINLNTKKICLSDEKGRFRIRASENDSLIVRNLAFRDTIVCIGNTYLNLLLKLRHKKYPIKELKVYEWGAGYEDFKTAFLALKVDKSLQEKLGLPMKDPDAIPFELDEELLKSAGFALSSPVSFLYYNLSKSEKSKRKVYQLQQTKARREKFNRIVSHENIGLLTGLTNEELENFRIYVLENLRCNYDCEEMEIIEEILELFSKR